MTDISLSPDDATAIILEAKKDKFGEGPIYAGNMPDSPDKRVTVATELLGFAIDAYVNDNIQGQEVTDILDAGHVVIAQDGTISQNGNGASLATKETVNPSAGSETVTLVNGDQEVTVPAAAATALEAAGWTVKVEAAPEPEPDPEPEATEPADTDEVTVDIGGTLASMPYGTAKALIASGAATLVPVGVDTDDPPAHAPESDPEPSAEGDPENPVYEEPWEGYDGEKDVDIRKKMQTFNDEEILYVKSYEAQNKNRQRIANFKPDPKKQRSAQEIAGDEAHSPGGDSLELEAADEAQAAADRDTVGEDPVPLVAEDEPAEDTDRMPILSAHQERELALAEVIKSRLPVPNEILESPPEFPDDISAVDDATLASLHSQFNSCLALANWKLGLVTVDERAFKHIAEAQIREVRKSLDHINPATGKPKGRDLMDREAEDDDTVQAWRERQHNADLRSIPLRKLVDIYSSHVDVLSRQWTFREKERDSSGSLAPRA